jgi:hypothetical protein
MLPISLVSLLGGPLIKSVVETFIGPAERLFEAYFQKQITKDQLAEKLGEAMLSSFASVEQAFQQALASTYASAMQAIGANARMQRVWATVALIELFVLFWHQFCIPAVTAVVRLTHPGWNYPGSGATVDWAYALIALCLGAPAISARIGPAASWTADALSRLAKR